SPCLPAALPADPDDHHGRHPRRTAVAAGRCRGGGDAPAAGAGNHRRADVEPDSHALHHTGGLSVSGSPASPLLSLPRHTHRCRPGKSVMSTLSLKNTLRPLPALIMALSLSACTLGDRKSTRLNSSHVKISYAVFCLKKKTTN